MGGLLLLAFLALALGLQPARSAYAQTTDLIISEYIDGSISNQAIEIYNGTGATVNLSNYRLELYSNTNMTPNAAITLSGSLANDATWVIVNPGAGPALQAYANQLSNVASFNGNDSLVLRRNGAVVDSFGRIGENPPNGWQGGGVRTFEVTLRRKPNVCAGRTDPNAFFDPSQEWDQFPQDTFDGLGSHTNNCNVSAPAPLINEFVFNHVGQNTHEYIEIHGQSNVNYSAYTILVVDGRSQQAGGNPGQVYRTYPVGATTPNGFWFTGFLTDQIHNGTTTLLLVRNFNQGIGIDLDPNNDGILDFTYWTDLADSVAISASLPGDRTYSNVVLYPGFGGNPQMVGGASRIPNAINSGSINDWRRNHFNGQGLGCASCSGAASNNEAINTPNYTNQLGSGQPTLTPVYPTLSPYPTTTIYPTASPAPATPIPPLPGNCVNLIRNYSFESNSDWTFGQDPVPARYVGEQQHSGLRSLLLGNPPLSGSQNKKSYSSVRQLVTVPADGVTAYLRWWHIHYTQEGVTNNPSRYEDRQDAILLAQNLQPMKIASRVRQNNGGWQESQVDLTGYIGKTFYVYFNAFNDGNGLRTWQYLDDVQMLVCYPDGYTPMPPTPMPPIQPTAPVYPTAPIYPTVPVYPTAPVYPTVPVYPTGYPTACAPAYTTCPGPTATSGIEIITPSPGATATGTEVIIGVLTPITTPVPTVAPRREPPIQPSPAMEGSPAVDPLATAVPVEPSPTEIQPTPVQPASDQLTATVETGDQPGVGSEPSAKSTPPTASPQPEDADSAQNGDQDANGRECIELVRNGDFELADAAWMLVANKGEVAYATEIVAGGKQSIRIGMTIATDQPYESYAAQSVDLPDAYGSIVLTYNYHPMTNALSTAPDLQLIDIYNDLTGQLARRIMREQRDDRTWLYGEDDITSLSGQKIQLRFTVIDSGGNNTAMYVDDVSIQACNPLPPRTETVDAGNGGESNAALVAVPTRTRWLSFGGWFTGNDTMPSSSASGASSGGFFDSLGSIAIMLGILLIIALVIWGVFFRPRRKSS